MDKSIQTLAVCLPAVVAYIYLFTWTQVLLKEINNDKNPRGVVFSAYSVWYKRNQGFPFLLITLVSPVVLGFIAGPRTVQGALVPTLLTLLESILVTLITLEFAYWSSANSKRCVPLVRAALFVDLLVLICLMRFVDGAQQGEATQTSAEILEVPALFFVGVTALVASFRCIYAAAIYDSFLFSPDQPASTGSASST
jgi:hypothetical protein